jgi:dimethylsulfone monooxygenase
MPTGEEAVTAPLRNDNAMQIGIFMMNVSGGTTVTKVEENRIIPTWEQNVRIARAADEAGWEFLLPLGRWRGFGGETNHNGRQFEVYTWAAGLSALTSQIQIFATGHVPLMHPIVAAKQGATIDHIGGGRFGLNIVSGWNIDEMGMFGIEQREHDERYTVSDEWATIVERLWTEEEEFDFEGKYFKVAKGYLQPKPIQSPRPVMVSAGNSEAGLRFAAKHCDFGFQTLPDLEELEKANHETRRLAADFNREIGLLTSAYVVCADTETEAKRYQEHYVEELGDWEAADNMVRQLLGGQGSWPEEAMKGAARGLIAGWGGNPLVGTPEQIVDQLVKLEQIGTNGVALSWVDYEGGLAQFNEQILPLMVQAGLRK